MKFIFIFCLFISAQFTTAATSREERANLDFQAGIMTGLDHKLATTQLMLSVFLNQDDMIVLKGGEGEGDEEEGDEEYQTVVGLQYKHFTGNSFYLAPELFYINYTENDDTPSFFDRKDERITALGLSFKIGNQWQWKHFTVGCDWVGLGRTLIHFNRTDDFLSDLSFTLLNVYVGWSF